MSVLFETTTVRKHQFNADSQWKGRNEQKPFGFSAALLTDVSETLTNTAVLSLKYAFDQHRLS